MHGYRLKYDQLFFIITSYMHTYAMLYTYMLPCNANWGGFKKATKKTSWGKRLLCLSFMKGRKYENYLRGQFHTASSIILLADYSIQKHIILNVSQLC